MNDFLKDCIDAVAGIEIKNETQAIAKEVVLTYFEDLYKEKQDLIKYLEDKIKEATEYTGFGLEKAEMLAIAYQEILDKIKEGNYE